MRDIILERRRTSFQPHPRHLKWSKNSPPRTISEELQESNQLAGTAKTTLRHNTMPLSERRSPKFVGGRFFYECNILRNESVNLITIKEISKDEQNELPQAAPGPSKLRTVRRFRGGVHIGDRAKLQ